MCRCSRTVSINQVIAILNNIQYLFAEDNKLSYFHNGISNKHIYPWYALSKPFAPQEHDSWKLKKKHWQAECTKLGKLNTRLDNMLSQQYTNDELQI